MNEKYLVVRPVSSLNFGTVQKIGRHGGRFDKKTQAATIEVRG